VSSNERASPAAPELTRIQGGAGPAEHQVERQSGKEPGLEPLVTGGAGSLAPCNGSALPLSFRCARVVQRNWSRVAAGEVWSEGRRSEAERVFLKQYVDAEGRSHAAHWSADRAGASVARAILGAGVWVPAVLASDPARLIHAFEYHECESVDGLLRRNRDTIVTRFDELMRCLTAALEAMIAAAATAEYASLPAKSRSFDSARRAVNFKGLDIRNVGLSASGGAFVMFDFGQPYLAPVEEAAAKLFVSVGLLNWGRPLGLFWKGPDFPLLERAHAHLAPFLHLHAIEHEIAAQTRMRMAEPKASGRLERALKRIGIASLGAAYFQRLSRWCRAHL
jgi:hypothetical protein